MSTPSVSVSPAFGAARMLLGMLVGSGALDDPATAAEVSRRLREFAAQEPGAADATLRALISTADEWSRTVVPPHAAAAAVTGGGLLGRRRPPTPADEPRRRALRARFAR